MSIHPEDAMAYADQLHRDCAEIADELRGIGDALGKLVEMFALSLDGERGFRVNGLIVTREDRP